MKHSFLIAILMLLTVLATFAEEIKVYRGDASSFPSEYKGVKESSTLFFAQADLAEGMFIELYNPAIASAGIGRKSAQVLIVKRVQRDGAMRGRELTLSPQGSNYFSIRSSGYLISNPRDEHSLAYLPEGFNSDTPTPAEIAPYRQAPVAEVQKDEKRSINPPEVQKDEKRSIKPPDEKYDYEMFGDSVIYILEEAEEKPPVDTSPPIDMAKFIDEYEDKETIAPIRHHDVDEDGTKESPEEPYFWNNIEKNEDQRDTVKLNSHDPDEDHSKSSPEQPYNWRETNELFEVIEEELEEILEEIKESLQEKSPPLARSIDTNSGNATIDQHSITALKPNAHYIQVGIYSHPAVLENNILRLKTRLPVVVIPFERNGQQLYRLFVGNFKADELGAVGYSLRSLGFTDFFLVNSGAS